MLEEATPIVYRKEDEDNRVKRCLDLYILRKGLSLCLLFCYVSGTPLAELK
jgi:hypothetical protein